jgi:hypothetical protein
MGQQLELFEVLSAEEEQQKSDTLNRIIKNHKRRMDLTQRKKNILLENGFVEGTHFVVEENIETENIEYEIGYGYDDTRKSFTDKIDVYKGDCYLIVKDFNEKSNIIKNRNITFDLEKGKLNSYSLQNYSCRFIKPTTMLNKLVEASQRADYKCLAHNKTALILEHTLNKYKTLYPNAHVVQGTGYISTNSSYYEWKTVVVTFKSGSSITLRLGTDKDKEYISKSKDVVVDEMSLTEKMNYFNNQA